MAMFIVYYRIAAYSTEQTVHDCMGGEVPHMNIEWDANAISSYGVLG